MSENYEPCGFCGGAGVTYGSMYDNHGAKRHDEPPRRTCFYCAGSGVTKGGHNLLPAESRESIIQRQSD